MDFGLDMTPFSLADSSLSIGFNISDTLEGLASYISLPVVYADEGPSDYSQFHSSFDSIIADNTRGGRLLQQVLVHIHSHEQLGLPLYLSSAGIKASHSLISMLNCLPVDGSSAYAGDNLL